MFFIGKRKYMKAKELMIGNYVYNTELKQIDQVTCIEEERVGLKNANLPYTPIGKIEPIPLTEQWLLDLGFEKKSFTYGLGKLSICLRRSNGYENGRTYYNSWAIIDSMPEFVHQLQNLHYVLTGKELII
jgi:hypothetical protein